MAEDYKDLSRALNITFREYTKLTRPLAQRVNLPKAKAKPPRIFAVIFSSHFGMGVD